MTAEGLREKARELVADREQLATWKTDYERVIAAMTLALEEAERAACANCQLSHKPPEGAKWIIESAVNGKHIVTYSDGTKGSVECVAAAIASLRSELGSGPEGEER